MGKGGDGQRLTLTELWKGKTGDKEAEASWYASGQHYWSEATADDDGVLGGMAYVSNKESVESLDFIDLLVSSHGLLCQRALDCGAGVGRVTEHALGKRFPVVDLVEQEPAMLLQARLRLNHSHLPILRLVSPSRDGEPCTWETLVAPAGMVPSDAPLPPCTVGKFLCCGLQDFRFDACEPLANETREASASEKAVSAPAPYSIVWLQWVIGCVNDVDLVRLLRDAAAAVAPCGGFVVIKDNVILKEEEEEEEEDGELELGHGDFFVYDDEDDSIARSEAYLMRLIGLAGLQVVEQRRSLEDEDDLLPVMMIALKPNPE